MDKTIGESEIEFIDMSFDDSRNSISMGPLPLRSREQTRQLCKKIKNWMESKCISISSKILSKAMLFQILQAIGPIQRIVSHINASSKNFYISLTLPLFFLEHLEEIDLKQSQISLGIATTTSLLELDAREKAFYISPSGAKLLSSLKGECFVISVSGSPMLGKSTLLNMLISLVT